MKTLKLTLFWISLVLMTTGVSAGGKISSDCTFHGKKLYGKVKVTNHANEDFRVRVVPGAEDLRVKKVRYNPNRCGQWTFVDHNPDFTIRFVRGAEHFTIRYVSGAEGL